MSMLFKSILYFYKFYVINYLMYFTFNKTHTHIYIYNSNYIDIDFDWWMIISFNCLKFFFRPVGRLLMGLILFSSSQLGSTNLQKSHGQRHLFPTLSGAIPRQNNYTLGLWEIQPFQWFNAIVTSHNALNLSKTQTPHHITLLGKLIT